VPKSRTVVALGVAVMLVACFAAADGAGAARQRSHGARTSCRVPGRNKSIDQLYRPDMRAAIAYARTRGGDIAFAVRSDHAFYAYRPDHIEWSASMVKSMMMVAYLDEPGVADRALDGRDGSLLWPMITESDNDAADEVYDIIGPGALYALAARVGMQSFSTQSIWGETHVTARGLTKFFLHLDSYVVKRHQGYAMAALSKIVPYERWGVGEVAPRGWKLYFKGGWGSGTGLIDSQVALLRRGCSRVSAAVLTMHDPSHAYGKATLRGLFARLLHGIPTFRRDARNSAR
jgi:Beta-lactamase enzyme family